MKKRRERYGWGNIAALGFTAFLTAGLDIRLRTVSYQVTTTKVTAPVYLAVISDLHSCRYGKEQQVLLNAVTAAAPNAILFTGDIVDDKMPEDNAWTTVSALSAKFPCFYVTGNHEWRSGEVDRICRDMQSYGVSVLRGNTSVVYLNGQPIQISGIDDMDSGKFVTQLTYVGNTLEEGLFSILLTHRPERIAMYQTCPFDLILAGHAHGGQWRLPKLLNGLYAPQQGLFPKYAGGRYRFGNTTLIVSRGLARENIPVPRFYNRPELVTVRIAPEQGVDIE